MDKFIIEGGRKLGGEFVPQGNKNAALPILAACLLTEDDVILHNVPQIRDVLDMRQLLASLGAHFEDIDESTWKVSAKQIHAREIDPDLAKRIRASILLAGPVTARAGEIILPPPGGDVIGRRRIDTHIWALRKLGAEVEYERTFSFKRGARLVGADILPVSYTHLRAHET